MLPAGPTPPLYPHPLRVSARSTPSGLPRQVCPLSTTLTTPSDTPPTPNPASGPRVNSPRSARKKVCPCHHVVIQWNLQIVGTIGTHPFVLCREVVLFRRLFCTECVYESIFGVSFVGRYVLFRSVLYRKFHCSLVW